MSCSSCGAKNGHYPGCKHYTGPRAGRRPKGTPPPKQKRTCSWCGGTGKNSKGTNCIRCGGSGEV